MPSLQVRTGLAATLRPGWQVYAPVEDSDAAFHRMLYLFLSPHSERLAGAGAARVLRCQLPRHNAYYSPDPPASRQPPPLPVSCITVFP